MPTVGEGRIAALEEWRRSIDARLWGDGGAVSYDRSIEGRVAAVERNLSGADALAQAAVELRRSTIRAWSRWEKAGLFMFAAVTTACSVIAAVAVLTG